MMPIAVQPKRLLQTEPIRGVSDHGCGTDRSPILKIISVPIACSWQGSGTRTVPIAVRPKRPLQLPHLTRGDGTTAMPIAVRPKRPLQLLYPRTLSQSRLWRSFARIVTKQMKIIDQR